MKKGYKIDKATGEIVKREKISIDTIKEPVAIKNKRLLPVKNYCREAGITLTKLSQLCGLATATVPTRVREGDCRLSDMEEMATAAGYRFVWYWEKVDSKGNL